MQNIQNNSKSTCCRKFCNYTFWRCLNIFKYITFFYILIDQKRSLNTFLSYCKIISNSSARLLDLTQTAHLSQMVAFKMATLMRLICFITLWFSGYCQFVPWQWRHHDRSFHPLNSWLLMTEFFRHHPSPKGTYRHHKDMDTTYFPCHVTKMADENICIWVTLLS